MTSWLVYLFFGIVGLSILVGLLVVSRAFYLAVKHMSTHDYDDYYGC